MGCLYKRKKKLPTGETRELPTIWIKDYQNGRMVRQSTGTTKETVARRILRSREGDVEHGIPVLPKMGKVTFEDAAKDIVNDYTINHRRSLEGLQRRIDKHRTPFFRGRRMAAITAADVRAYVAKRKADVIVTGTGDERKERPVWNAEINNELKALKRMFSLAIAAGKLAHRPHIPMLKEDNVRTGFFEREQSEAVRRHLPDYLRPLVTFMYLTGWRRGEVSGLEWRQVNFDAGEVRLDPGSTKNGEGRVFPFTHELRELLKAQHAEHERLKKAGQIEPWVFFRMAGKRGSRVARREAQKPRPIERPGWPRAEPPAALVASRTTSAARRSATWCARPSPSASPCSSPGTRPGPSSSATTSCHRATCERPRGSSMKLAGTLSGIPGRHRPSRPAPNPRKLLIRLERETGIEPATSSLGRANLPENDRETGLNLRI
jgi:integrase